MDIQKLVFRREIFTTGGLFSFAGICMGMAMIGYGTFHSITKMPVHWTATSAYHPLIIMGTVLAAIGFIALAIFETLARRPVEASETLASSEKPLLAETLPIEGEVVPEEILSGEEPELEPEAI